jgi:hypothetical protein
VSLKKSLKKIFFGITLREEFICIDNDSFTSPLKIFLNSEYSELEPISSADHLFLGYQPLVIGIIAERDSARDNYLTQIQKPTVSFNDDKGNSVAHLKLNRFKVIENKNDVLFLFEGIYGSQTFQSTFHKFTNNLKYRLTANRESNVYLEGNLYQQLIIAYSVPRIISLVSLSDGIFCNLFPTDLNGKFGSENYIVSLRIGGKASEQVEMIKKLVISRLPVSECSYAYSLSKNHMMDLVEESSFKFKIQKSNKFNFPVPENAISCFELELNNSIEIGIHKLYFFSVVSNEKFEAKKSTLAHIHRNYAEWRKRNSLRSNFVSR